jgi:hypothetical protein
MCSVCFKEKEKNKDIIPNTSSTIINKVEDIPQVNSEFSNMPIDTNVTTSIVTNDIKMEEPIQEIAHAVLTRPVQTDTMFCWVCNKKVGYLGFKCKCEYIFCGSHRHFSDHNCDFDHRTYDRQKLVKKSDFGGPVDNNKMIK